MANQVKSLIRADKEDTMYPDYGTAISLSPLVRRLTCPNPGPLTYQGTNSYIIGQGKVAIIDPGPNHADHLQALLHATRHETVTHILVTHTHNDHSPNANKLKEITGGKTAAFWPRQTNGIDMPRGMETIGDKFVDQAFKPDIALQNGDYLKQKGWSLQSIHTPGHAPDHLCFALPEENAVFTGDHIMGWSSTVIAPPEGHMADYMGSLDILLKRNDKCFYPAHGKTIKAPQTATKQAIAHRNKREQSILHCLKHHKTSINEITQQLYAGIDPSLSLAAQLSVLAQLEYLIERGHVHTDGKPNLKGIFFLEKNTLKT